jgi:hypothetical protein
MLLHDAASRSSCRYGLFSGCSVAAKSLARLGNSPQPNVESAVAERVCLISEQNRKIAQEALTPAGYMS